VAPKPRESLEGLRSELRIELTPSQSVTALAYATPPENRAGVTLILGHGAGAGQTSGFMVDLATALVSRGIDTVTFNFSYLEHGRRVPDPNDTLEACYRSVVETLRKHRTLGQNPLAIGGKSMGGRIASQIAAADPDLCGLILLGYPLHPPGRPEKLRAWHLGKIQAPMLFIQGSRDAFGTPNELEPIVKKLKPPVTLYVVEGGDHSFKVPKSSGRPQQEVFEAVYDRIGAWIRETRGTR